MGGEWGNVGRGKRTRPGYMWGMVKSVPKVI